MRSNYWKFSSKETAAELGNSPEKLLETAKVVKDNGVRAVYDCGDYFLKLDRRKTHSFGKELKSAGLLADAGIPLVEHLAEGRCDKGCILVTRACRNSIALDSYIRKNQLSEKFYENYAAFLNRFYASGFYHSDAHTGNLLYSAETGEFILVDVRNVRKTRWLRFFNSRGDIIKFIMALRYRAADKKIIAIFEKCGIRGGRKIFDKSLTERTKHLMDEWAKRRTQLLVAYPKFSFEHDGFLTASDAPVNWQDADEVFTADAKKMFIASFFLKLSDIPHREIYAVKGKCIKIAPPVSDDGDEELIDQMQKRLAVCGFETAKSRWKYAAHSTLPVFCGLEDISCSPLFDTEK